MTGETHNHHAEMDVHLRICNLADYPEFLPLLARWHHEEWLKGWGLLKPGVSAKSLARRVEVLRSHMLDTLLPRSFVALYDGEPIASVSLVYFGLSTQQPQSLWLTNLYVPLLLRNKGLGALMLNYALDYASEHEKNQSRILLYTRDKEAYYRRRGWQDAGSGRVQGQAATGAVLAVVGPE